MRKIALQRRRNRKPKQQSGWRDVARSRRCLARAGAVAFLGLALWHGLTVGGHLEGEPLRILAGRIAGMFGYAAEDIRIAGINHQPPEAVLEVLDLEPGDALVWFDASRARERLEGADWVKSAQFNRLHPNGLEIRVVEREPFALWQRNGRFLVIDPQGETMPSLSVENYRRLLLVTGEGANRHALRLVNQLEAQPTLRLRVKAAARVGDRRWTLYLDDGVKVALPETGVPAALQALVRLQEDGGLLDKGIAEIDLRNRDLIVVAPLAEPDDAQQAALKVSRR